MQYSEKSSLHLERQNALQNYTHLYVVDTNILIDYPDIIPNGDSKPLENPTVDLAQPEFLTIIPTAVVRELESFKKESTDRGLIARRVLKRLRKIFESKPSKLLSGYSLSLIIQVNQQNLAILPIHKNFCQQLPFQPSDEDMDGQIILAALTTCALASGTDINVPFGGSLVSNQKVTLLTNDNGLAIRAHACGIQTSRFGYILPQPYTGRRSLKVPQKLYQDFLLNPEGISYDLWRQYMPNEPELIANEFIIMTSDSINPNSERVLPYINDLFPHIGRFDIARQSIVHLDHISNYPLKINNPGQAMYIEALNNPNIDAIIATGPAGSGKTFIATIDSYIACGRGEYIGITIVPCRTEDDDVGFLPGDLNEKMDPKVQPIKNALRNYLMIDDKDISRELKKLKKFGFSDICNHQNGKNEQLRNGDLQSKKSIRARLDDKVENIWNNWFKNIPITYARGRDFSLEIAIYDEFQDQNHSQADTLIKRIGKDGKIIITGDIEQIHAAYLDRDNNGLVYARNSLKGMPMVAQVNFTADEVVRHPLVRMLAERQNTKPL